MKTINLTQNKSVMVDNEDFDNGIFKTLNQVKEKSNG